MPVITSAILNLISVYKYTCNFGLFKFITTQFETGWIWVFSAQLSLHLKWFYNRRQTEAVEDGACVCGGTLD